jgi:histamine-gated chloride channel
MSRTSLEIADILPEDPKSYDRMRPPKIDGQAAAVNFHVTVMGLDSIDENSMVILIISYLFLYIFLMM